MAIQFSKMHGLGNDFVVIDLSRQSIPTSSNWITQISNRHLGVGCDQVLLLEATSTENIYRYRIFNSDGTEVMQCGNGARCVARYLFDKAEIPQNELQLITEKVSLVAKKTTANQIAVNMGVPNFEPQSIPLNVPERALEYSLQVDSEGVLSLRFSALSLGNPHAVLCVDKLSEIAVPSLGALIASQPVFPEGVNVGFMAILDEKTIDLRVYERGAGETQACGSGACAAAVIGQQLGFLGQNVEVKLLGGELRVTWEGEGQPVWMTGPAEFVFDGEYRV